MADATPDLLDAWQGWARSMSQANRLPLSGDVAQWIRAWGEAIAQVGLVNINVEGTADPRFERDISRDYSYGRQLGRMLDVLLPLAEASEAALRQQIGDARYDDFTSMARDIQRRKDSRQQASIDGIVGQVSAWRDRPQFAEQLQSLIERLQALAPPAAPPRARRR